MDTRFRGRVTDDTDSLSRAFTRASVCLSSLSSDGQAAEVADAAVAFDTLKALEIHTDFAAKVTFDDVFAILNRVDDLGQLLFAQIFRANGRVNVGLGQDVFRVAGSDAVNVTERDVDALIRRNFYANDTCHVRTGLVISKMFW
jgi:hypothetical protein